jgi:hypothetical protein
VRRIWNQHRAPLGGTALAITSVDVSANNHHAGHFSVSAGGGLQGDAGQSGYLRQVIL